MCGLLVSLHLVVHQSPLLQESMDPHDGTDISSQVAATGGAGQVLLGIQTVCVNHKVSVGHVSVGANCNYSDCLQRTANHYLRTAFF